MANVDFTLEDVRGLIKSELAEVRAEVAGVKAEVTEVKAEVAEIKVEVTEVRAEVADVKVEVVRVSDKVDRIKNMLEEDASAESRRLDKVQKQSEKTRRLLAAHVSDATIHGRTI